MPWCGKAVQVLVAAVLVALFCAGCANSHKQFGIYQVAPGIFEGFKPTTQEHFDALRQRGIRTILSVQDMPYDVIPERHTARREGFIYIDVPILASPLEPSEKRVRQALEKMNDPSLRPIYLHCLLGRDRTALLVGLYRIYYEGWSPDAAWNEMLRSGFRVRWSLRGFETYFWRHAEIPDWVKHSSPEREKQVPASGGIAH